MGAVGGLAGHLSPLVDDGPGRVGLGEEGPGQEELREVWVTDVTPPGLEGAIHTAGGMGCTFLMPIWQEPGRAPWCFAMNLGALLGQLQLGSRWEGHLGDVSSSS